MVVVLNCGSSNRVEGFFRESQLYYNSHLRPFKTQSFVTHLCFFSFQEQALGVVCTLPEMHLCQ